jgi:DtxR family transcriptional regulator, Mn-dependent transcriptional regulator
MPESLTNSIQDYLKIIYELTENGEPASTNALAARLGITAASVTGMVQKLSTLKPALVFYQKYQGVSLTDAGRKAALEVIRRHRLLEAWLAQSLGYSWDEVHNEADKLEHVISGEFETRIAAALGQPERDPHGEAIPNAQLVMPADESIPLASLEGGQEMVVRRVHAQDPALLRHFEELGLIPGAHLKVAEISPFDRVMYLQVQGRKETAIVGAPLSERIFVEIL